MMIFLQNPWNTSMSLSFQLGSWNIDKMFHWWKHLKSKTILKLHDWFNSDGNVKCWFCQKGCFSHGGGFIMHHCFGTNWGQCQEILPVVGNLTTHLVDFLPLDGNLTTGWKSLYWIEIILVGNLTTGWKSSFFLTNWIGKKSYHW